MKRLLVIITYLNDKLFVRTKGVTQRLKRKVKRKVSHFKDISSLNFHNVKRHKKALKRYNHIAAAKKNKRDKLSITQAYNTFSYTIIILIITWTFLNALSIYEDQQESFSKRIEVQKAIIEKNFSNSISLIDNFSSYVGDKILLFGVDDKKAIATILKKNNTSDSIVRNIYSWLDVDYVNSNKRLEVSSKQGVLPKSEDVPKYYPIKESIKKKWNFKMGKLTLIKSAYGDYQIIPGAFSIDDDDYNERGTLISRIIIQKVEDDINRGIEDEEVGYIVISKDYNIVASSKNNIILEEQRKKWLIEHKLSSNKELQEIFSDAGGFGVISKDGVLQRPINIGNTSYNSYRKSDYPFIILTSYSRKAMWNSFKDKLGYLLFQSAAITLLFLTALFIFKRIQIVPIIKQLINSRERAEEANKAKSSFLSTISHELRTPMNGIIGMSQILSESKNLDDEEWDQVKTIHRSANALLLILNDILNFSKIEAQKVELEKIDFNLYLLLENTIDLMSPAATRKGLELFMHIDKEIPNILVGDPGRIRQIITNLINNAIKFTAKGQVLIEIIYEKKFRNKYTLRFNVKDSGIGIKKNDLNNLFKKFTQADMSTTRKYGGTGLGLSICEELVKLMHGKIGIESKVGTGSNFWFSIPLHMSENDMPPIKLRERQKITNTNILLINSNKVGRDVMKIHIHNLFAQVGVDALDIPEGKDSFNDADFDKIVSQIQPDKYSFAIISNAQVKGFHGIKIANKIKKLDSLANIPLAIAISPHEKIKITPADTKLFSNIITKPIKEGPLIEAMFDAHQIKYQKDKRFLVEENSKKIGSSKATACKILMCEDNKINMKVAVAVMSRMGYEIDLAENGKEGLDKLFQKGGKKYDIVFMDCMMPVMDGFMATKQIRKEEALRNLKRTTIIALTANISKIDQDKCYKSGMDDFLSKPINKEQVREIIEKWMQKGRDDLA